MARKKIRGKRTYGTGCVIKIRNGLAIRWREPILLPDGSVRRELKYEALGSVSRKEANQALRDRLAVSQVARPGPITFEELANTWKRTVLPMYRKYSTRKHHAHILEKKLLPLFGNQRIDRIGRQYIQQVVSEWSGQGYSPSSIHHYHSVLSAILKKATEWGYVQFNPANGVKLPALVLVRRKRVLTPQQFGDLLSLLQPMARTQLLLMVLAGVRRGELFALRWRAFDESEDSNPKLIITEAVYDGVLDSPKTTSSLREVPLSRPAVNALREWRTIAPRTGTDGFIFSTVDGQPKSPKQVMRDHFKPACSKLGLTDVCWLTFRRTFSTWGDEVGVSAKQRGVLMGNSAEVNVKAYTQATDQALREGVERISERIVQYCSVSNGMVN